MSLHELKERLLSRIYPTVTNCWVYIGSKDSWGYGNISYQGRQLGTHRASWLVHKGEIPDNEQVLHTCGNRACINPDHLYLGSHQDNMRDRDERGRHHSGLTRLSEDEVRKIKHLLATTKRTMEDIGNEFMVTKYTIFDIKHGRTWPHVE